MVATARQKRLYLHHQGEFQHNYFDFVSLHHSDHDGVVIIFVGHSEIVKRLLHYLHYITRHNFLYTRSVMYVRPQSSAIIERTRQRNLRFSYHLWWKSIQLHYNWGIDNFKSGGGGAWV